MRGRLRCDLSACSAAGIEKVLMRYVLPRSRTRMPSSASRSPKSTSTCPRPRRPSLIFTVAASRSDSSSSSRRVAAAVVVVRFRLYSRYGLRRRRDQLFGFTHRHALVDDLVRERNLRSPSTASSARAWPMSRSPASSIVCTGDAVQGDAADSTPRYASAPPTRPPVHG